MEQGVFFLLFAAVAVILIVFHFTRSDSLLQRWAKQNGFRIVREEYCWFSKGPFFWTSSRGQTVYYVTVEDKDGVRRNGWVRCGGLFLGLFSDKVEVRWDDEAG